LGGGDNDVKQPEPEKWYLRKKLGNRWGTVGGGLQLLTNSENGHMVKKCSQKFKRNDQSTAKGKLLRDPKEDICECKWQQMTS